MNQIQLFMYICIYILYVYLMYIQFDQWDEPNTGKWVNSNLTSYEETYSYTAKAVGNVNETFRLGAPGTAGAVWLPDFPEWYVVHYIIQILYYQQQNKQGKSE